MALALIPEGMRSAALPIPNGLLPLSALFNTHNLVHEAVLEQWAITFGIIGFLGYGGDAHGHVICEAALPAVAVHS